MVMKKSLGTLTAVILLTNILVCLLVMPAAAAEYGGRCLRIVADSNNSNIQMHLDLRELEAYTDYELTVYAKYNVTYSNKEGFSGGLFSMIPNSTPAFAAVQCYDVGSKDWEKYSRTFTTLGASKMKSIYLQFVMWHVKGEFLIDSIKITKLETNKVVLQEDFESTKAFWIDRIDNTEKDKYNEKNPYPVEGKWFSLALEDRGVAGIYDLKTKKYVTGGGDKPLPIDTGDDTTTTKADPTGNTTTTRPDSGETSSTGTKDTTSSNVTDASNNTENSETNSNDPSDSIDPSESTNPGASTKPVVKDDPGGVSPVVFIIIGIVVVLGVGGAAVYFFIIRKKPASEG